MKENKIREHKYKGWDGKNMLDAEDLTTAPKHRKWLGHKDITLLQYTGLKDKNGVEIYEGDLVNHVRFTHLYKFNNYTSEVTYLDSGFKLSYIYSADDNNGKIFFKDPSSITTSWLSGIKEKCEVFKVIGNKFENPELLKETK